MHTLKLRHEITIHALTSKVWKVLTSRDYTEQFLFEGDLVTDWAIEGPILLEVEEKGQKQIVNKGIIEEIVPGISLRFKISGLQYSNDPVIFHYELIPEEGGIRLILSVEILFLREELQKMMTANCKMMLQKIKWLAEYS